LLHDNAPAHKALVLPILDRRPPPPKKNYNPLSPSYSPNLSPPNYFPFPKLKIKLKGLLFADIADIREAATNELKKIQKEEFSAIFQELYDH
jgi:hypothetical protein